MKAEGRALSRIGTLKRIAVSITGWLAYLEYMWQIIEPPEHNLSRFLAACNSRLHATFNPAASPRDLESHIELVDLRLK